MNPMLAAFVVIACVLLFIAFLIDMVAGRLYWW